MAKSRPAPSFLIFAGARFTVIFFTGKWNPLFLSAARTRSRLSRTVASGSPTIENWGRPDEMSTSTSTRCASTPTIAALKTFASTVTSQARYSNRALTDTERLKTCSSGRIIGSHDF